MSHGRGVRSRHCRPLGNVVCHRHGDWLAEKLESFVPAAESALPYRNAGVYLVVGGAGGLGEAWTRMMIERYRARVIWTGRRPLDVSIQARIEALGQHGPAPIYLQADAASREDWRDVHRVLAAEHGIERIDGVVHAALQLHDASLGNLGQEQFASVVLTKVATSARMAEAFMARKPDFMLFFSSLQAFSKAPGQANYAAGCSFADAFAAQLAQQGFTCVKVINWGYWGSIGAVATDAYRKRMQRMGMASIESEDGMRALDMLMRASVSRMVYSPTIEPTQELAAEQVSQPRAMSLAARVKHRLQCQPS
jgi:NAD(P)-dependent dehydrogenase (short-subunit alcohol dehydrogenase family)